MRFDIPGSYAIKNEKGKTICLDSAAFKGVIPENSDIKVQILIRDCENCFISIKSLIGSMRIENVSGCQILIGPCCTSTYLESVVDSVVLSACHQLRIHQSHRCTMMVRVNSHPIIEDCSAMRFAPYLMEYVTNRTYLLSCSSL